jgi:two-component system, NarL family, response regulator
VKADHPWRITIMIVDDHEIVRQGLKVVIGAQRDMEIVAETGEAHEVVPLFAASCPDLVLMDLRLRNGSGLDAIRALKASFAASRIVVLSNYGSEEHVFRAMTAGAQGFVMKDGDASQIIDALRAVHRGHRYLSTEATSRFMDRIHRSSLTPREEEVLTLLVHGTRNRTIADELSICSETVKGHVKNILVKLGVRDRTEAVSEAIRRGLVDVD